LILLNEWGGNRRCSKDRLKEYKRELFEEIKKLLTYRQITIISGLRRAGKSTLMFQLIDFLLKHKKIKKSCQSKLKLKPYYIKMILTILDYFIKKFKSKVSKGIIVYEGETKKGKIMEMNKNK